MTVTGETLKPVSLSDRWILARLGEVIEQVNSGLEKFRVGEVVQLLYHFFWNDLCSWYIEFSKPVFNGTDDAQKSMAQQVLRYTLDMSLRLLHPLMPFITETLWQRLPKDSAAPESIMLAKFPDREDCYQDEQALIDTGNLMEIVTAVRTVRSEYNVAPSKKISLDIKTDDLKLVQFIKDNELLITTLAKVAPVTVVNSKTVSGTIDNTQVASAVAAGAELLIPLSEIVDYKAEKERLKKERLKLEKIIAQSQKKLSNRKFVSNAPADVVKKEQLKSDDAELKLKKIKEALTRIAE
jgi:valyl-tRNA synthetase